MTQLGVFAEVVAHHHVGRAREHQHLAQQAVDVLDMDGMQAAMGPAALLRGLAVVRVARAGLANGRALVILVLVANGLTRPCGIAAHDCTSVAAAKAVNSWDSGGSTRTTPACTRSRPSTNQRTARG